jgi:hypothetical protein
VNVVQPVPLVVTAETAAAMSRGWVEPVACAASAMMARQS